MNSCTVSTANITDVKLCEKLQDGLCPTDQDVFSTTTPKFYVSCILRNAPDDTEVTFSWYYFGDEKILIDEVTISSEDKGATVNLQSNLSIPDNGWPVGEYEVVIKIHTDNSEPISRNFKVE
jgi:hypothetical protein